MINYLRLLPLSIWVYVLAFENVASAAKLSRRKPQPPSTSRKPSLQPSTGESPPPLPPRKLSLQPNTGQISKQQRQFQYSVYAEVKSPFGVVTDVTLFCPPIAVLTYENGKAKCEDYDDYYENFKGRNPHGADCESTVMCEGVPNAHNMIPIMEVFAPDKLFKDSKSFSPFAFEGQVKLRRFMGTPFTMGTIFINSALYSSDTRKQNFVVTAQKLKNNGESQGAEIRINLDEKIATFLGLVHAGFNFFFLGKQMPDAPFRASYHLVRLKENSYIKIESVISDYRTVCEVDRKEKQEGRKYISLIGNVAFPEFQRGHYGGLSGTDTHLANKSAIGLKDEGNHSTVKWKGPISVYVHKC